MNLKGDLMKRNFMISLVLTAIAFGLLIASIVLCILEKETICMYLGMGSSAAAFISILFGLGGWKEK